MPFRDSRWSGPYRRHRLAVVAVLTLGAVGCGSGDGLPRQAVSGGVTLDGLPLASGFIAFQPADPAAVGVAVGATIQGGSYSVSRAAGPVPGSYRVAITSPQEVQATAKTSKAKPGDGDAPPALDLIPPQFNARTTLKADVTAGGGNQFDFDLKAH